MSESNYRFERGVDPVAVETASLRACQLILDSAGGKLADGVVDVWARPFEAASVSVRPQRCCDLLGMDVPVERQVEILNRLNLRPERNKDRIVCTIPPYRADLGREVDLIEEIARHVGYDAIPVAGEVTHPVNPQGPTHRIRSLVARTLAAAGFDEAITFAFVDVEQAGLFGSENPICVDRAARKTNNALRPTLLISLLTACKANQDVGNADVSLYELAAVFPPGGTQSAREHVELAMATTGDLRDLRGAVEALVATVAPAATLTVTEADAAGMAKGLSGRIMLNGAPAGIIGCVASEVQEAFDLEREIAAATIDFESLLAVSQQRSLYQPVPRFPAVKRDLSLIVDEKVKWSGLADAITAVEQPMRVAVEYVTTFRGEPIPAGRKSVTVTLVYRSAEGTLRSEEVDTEVAVVVAALAKEFSAELRE
jgi:phenylalanyl-tRNA synthetase beta chain